MASQQANVPSSSRSAHTATHLHAASIAVPDASIVERLESQLLQITQQSSPFLQRDVILHRTDELDEGRMEVEKSNSSYAPMRKARLQSNLHLRFEEQKVEMRVYSQTQGGSGGTIHSLGGAIGATGSKYHPPDYIRLRNLTCSLLHGDEVAVGNYCESSTDDPNHSLPPSINAGSGIWKQVVATMGWTPHHTVVRKGECFVIRDRHGHRTEARLFQLYKVDDVSNPTRLSQISPTKILQIVVTISLQMKSTLDPVKLVEQACSDIQALQESFQGLVELSKDAE